jgi:Ran GTPase-activating protein (RanGAP) involved in mRNA processing and transport
MLLWKFSFFLFIFSFNATKKKMSDRWKNDDLDLICEKLQKNRIEEIDFSKIELKENEMQDFCEALEGNKSLKTLNLSGKDLSLMRNFKKICLCLIKFSSLEILDLSLNNFTQKQIDYFCELLKENSSLKSIDLSLNSLGDTKLKELSKVLKVNTILESIQLRSNGIGHRGISYFM